LLPGIHLIYGPSDVIETVSNLLKGQNHDA
jgi:hypothetical protein